MITKKRITITVDTEVHKEFREILEDEGVPVSFVVNMLIKDFIELYSNKEETEDGQE